MSGSHFQVRHPDATVWLGNLPAGVSFEDLRTHMSQAGTCKRAQLTSGNTGFAWYSSAEEAQQALVMLNGSILNGQSIVVDTWTKKEGGEKKSWDNNKGSWSNGGKGGKGGGKGVWQPQLKQAWGAQPQKGGWGAQPQKGGWGAQKGGWGNNGGWGAQKSVKFEVRKPDATVWVGSLPEGLTFEELKEHMSQAGEVKHAQLTSGNTGFVWFKEAEQAQTAIMMLNGSILKDSAIIVDPWAKKEKK